jgi:SAM-dependent methyltransferase
LTLANGANPGCLWYEAASPVIFRQFMAALEIPFDDFEFVDYGSGKGRVLMLAAEQGFRKATGIEFAGELVEVARKNVEIFNRSRAKPAIIESRRMDAKDYVLPDVPLVLFFFQPVQGRCTRPRARQRHRVLRAESASPLPRVQRTEPGINRTISRHWIYFPRNFAATRPTRPDSYTTAASSSPHLTVSPK